MGNEFDYIDWIRKQNVSRDDVPVGPGDDCAIVKTPSGDLLAITTDMIVEGRHFAPDTPPRLVGRKALAISLSDIAAMGFRAAWTVAAVNLPRTRASNLQEELYRGLREIADEFGVAVVGGNVTASDGELNLCTTVFGISNGKPPVLRSGARPGDEIWVTGPLGNSFASGKHLTFTPRLREAEFLTRNFNLNSMIDISDGLAQDLRHILSESRVGAVIQANLIPLNNGASLEQALGDGEDFELLFTLPHSESERLRSALPSHPDLKFQLVGIITEATRGARLILPDGTEQDLPHLGWDHLR